MSDRDIVDLKQFLEKCLKKTVLDYTLSDLTRPGENYGSILQALEVTLADANDDVSAMPMDNGKTKRAQLYKHVNFFSI